MSNSAILGYAESTFGALLVAAGVGGEVASLGISTPVSLYLAGAGTALCVAGAATVAASKSDDNDKADSIEAAKSEAKDEQRRIDAAANRSSAPTIPQPTGRFGVRTF